MKHYIGTAINNVGNNTGFKKGSYEDVTSWAETVFTQVQTKEVLISEIKEVARRSAPPIVIEDYVAPETIGAAIAKHGNGQTAKNPLDF